MGYDVAHAFLAKLEDMVEFLLPNYVAEGKNQLVIAIGCTGGHHRSVTLAGAALCLLERAWRNMVRGSSTAISEDSLTSAKREEGRHVSFSSEVKEELSRQDTSARHCRLAELAAIIGMCGDVCISAMERLPAPNPYGKEAVARKCFTFIAKTFSINSDVSVHLHKRNGKGSQIYTLLIRDHAEVLRVLQALKLVDAAGEIQEQVSPANQLLVQKSCCRRAFIRGAFLGSRFDQQSGEVLSL